MKSRDCNKLKRFLLPIGIFLLFETIAVTLWRVYNHPFYLFNFSYIGFFVSLGIFLMNSRFKYARVCTELFIGIYMLVYLGVINRENMQLEGFFYYASIGLFQAAVLHYTIAKIAGPFIFGRAWCGYACWTAMILDLFPFRIPKNERRKGLGFLRIGIFALSGLCFYLLSVYGEVGVDRYRPQSLYIGFLVGNGIYYAAGIALAFLLKDNRAFCKYLCPVTVFLKPASYFALLRVYVDQKKCTSCHRCEKACPMDVDILNNKRNRKNGTECILCGNCIRECPQKAVSFKKPQK